MNFCRSSLKIAGDSLLNVSMSMIFTLAPESMSILILDFPILMVASGFGLRALDWVCLVTV